MKIPEIIETEYNILTNNKEKSYINYEKSSVKAKMVLPTTTDLFSAATKDRSTVPVLMLDKLTEDNKILYQNPVNGRVFEIDSTEDQKYSFRPVITISGELIIKSGKGTVNNPYYLR